jgi:putative ABC transport system substrate-binding protein
LRELGYVEGRTLVFEYRDAEWKVERLPALAGDLVQSKVDVIFTPWGTAAALAAKRATTCATRQRWKLAYRIMYGN